MKSNAHFLSYLAQFFLEWDMFQTKVVDKIETHFMFNNFFFFRKSCLLWDDAGKILWNRTGHELQYGACMEIQRFWLHFFVNACLRCFIKLHGAAQNAVGSCCTGTMTVSVFSVVEKICSFEVIVRPDVFSRISPILMTSAEDELSLPFTLKCRSKGKCRRFL